MKTTWTSRVLADFSDASRRYDTLVPLQRAIARRLAGHCARQNIPPGLWVDLGSGTGLLADALESLHPGQSVLRLDGSAAMLARHGADHRTATMDLSCDLPQWQPSPTLLASSFTLHWLPSPERRLLHWLHRLDANGWLALSVPIQGSFPQWHKAAADAALPCTALPLPSGADLIERLPRSTLHTCRTLRFTQTADHPLHLLKPMAAIGAGSTPSAQLTAAAWRKLFQAWPRQMPGRQAGLTWHVMLLLLKR